MFAVIYQFYLEPSQEAEYQRCFQLIANYCIEHCGAIGSVLHQGEAGLWVAYSRWPDKKTRDAAWPVNDAGINPDFPREIIDAIELMKKISVDNSQSEPIKPIELTVANDLLLR